MRITTSRGSRGRAYQNGSRWLHIAAQRSLQPGVVLYGGLSEIKPVEHFAVMQTGRGTASQ